MYYLAFMLMVDQVLLIDILTECKTVKITFESCGFILNIPRMYRNAL